MKRSLVFFILAVLPASAQWRKFGQDQTHLSGFFGGGFSTPVNPTANRLDTGWNLSGGVGVTGNYVGVMLDGMYSDFGITHRNLVQQGARSGSEKYFAFTVNPIFHVNERGPIDFYVTGGAGIYSQITRYRAFAGDVGPRRFDLISTDQIYKPGVNAGAGFSFRLSDFNNIKIFTEARYHRMFVGPRDVSMIPVTLGIRF